MTRRRLRWGYWSDIDTERRFFCEANQRYNAFLLSRHLSFYGPPRTAAVIDGEGEGGIPRIIHHIWLGPPPPETLDSMRAGWQSYHSTAEGGWKHRLWTEDEVHQAFPHGLRNQVAFDEAKNYGQKSDILRYEILYHFGGVYVDADMECLASLDDLHESISTGTGHLTFYTGFSNTGTIELNNGLIGSIAGHPILKELIERIEAWQQGKSNKANGSNNKARETTKPLQQQQQQQQGLGAILGFLGNEHSTELQILKKALDQREKEDAAMNTIEDTGPGLFTRTVSSWLLAARQKEEQEQEENAAGHLIDSNILLAPPLWFYPVPNTVISKKSRGGSITWEEKEGYVVPGVSRTIHHWACSWQTPPS